jgi:hypothetical protein
MAENSSLSWMAASTWNNRSMMSKEQNIWKRAFPLLISAIFMLPLAASGLQCGVTGGEMGFIFADTSRTEQP